MIGDVGCEIRIAAVRFLQRPVDIVAEIRGFEQRLLAILPILEIAALGRRQPAFIDFAALTQAFDRGSHFVTLALDQRTFGKEHIEMYIERGEIIPDHVHHHGNRLRAHNRKPLGFRPAL